MCIKQLLTPLLIYLLLATGRLVRYAVHVERVPGGVVERVTAQRAVRQRVAVHAARARVDAVLAALQLVLAQPHPLLRALLAAQAARYAACATTIKHVEYVRPAGCNHSVQIMLIIQYLLI